MVRHRSNDTEVGFTVKREIPLWGIFIACASLIGYGVLQYVGQVQQGSKIDALMGSFQAFVADQRAQNTTLQGMQNSLIQLTGRVTSVEQRISRIEGKVDRP